MRLARGSAVPRSRRSSRRLMATIAVPAITAATIARARARSVLASSLTPRMPNTTSGEYQRSPLPGLAKNPTKLSGAARSGRTGPGRSRTASEARPVVPSDCQGLGERRREQKCEQLPAAPAVHAAEHGQQGRQQADHCRVRSLRVVAVEVGRCRAREDAEREDHIARPRATPPRTRVRATVEVYLPLRLTPRA